MKYLLVSGSNIGQFNQEVNLRLSQGWELFGDTKVIVLPQNGYSSAVFFYQSMKHMKSINAEYSNVAAIDLLPEVGER